MHAAQYGDKGFDETKGGRVKGREKHCRDSSFPLPRLVRHARRPSGEAPGSVFLAFVRQL